MKAISLKLRDNIFQEVERVVRAIHVSRNAYINDALFLYNQLNHRRLLKKQLRKESRAVREVSLGVLSQLENLEDSFDE